ncbi:hypothetical protein [Asaia spathodeae]|uniref:Uncharacterized protein n=1 Tax=Asaia spathodeae TaxID=657016 RepID=A0ABX2P787_9PROT|nr:hypothetical protein [Asaia spathodeae]GBR19091.1 hypothetical protein AA105894_2223 [Asaia spathodeae NBRC 105894]
MTISIMLHLSGRFDVAAFREFAESRARLLGLDMTPQRMEGHEIVFLLRGAHALVGMFVMACVIGPASCVVSQWREAAA